MKNLIYSTAEFISEIRKPQGNSSKRGKIIDFMTNKKIGDIGTLISTMREENTTGGSEAAVIVFRTIGVCENIPEKVKRTANKIGVLLQANEFLFERFKDELAQASFIKNNKEKTPVEVEQMCL